MTRRVLKLQTYDFEIVFVESRIQPADVVSQWDKDDNKDGIYHQRFLFGHILNGFGEEVPLEILFCNKTNKELKKFFQKTKRQTQSKPHDIDGPTNEVPEWQTKHEAQRPDLEGTRDTSPDAKDSTDQEEASKTLEGQGASSKQASNQASIKLIQKRNFYLHSNWEKPLSKTELSILAHPARNSNKQAKTKWLRHAMKRWASKGKSITPTKQPNQAFECSPCSNCIPLGGDVSLFMEVHCLCVCQ